MTDLIADAAAPQTPSARSERPRFRLQHLFVLTAVMAVMLAIGGQQNEYPSEANLPPLFQQLMTGLGIVFSILNAIAITAAGYGWYWRRQGRPFFDQPGHWLIAAMAILAVVTSIQVLGFRVLGIWGDFDQFVSPSSPASSLQPATFAFLIGMALFGFAYIAIHVALHIIIGRKQAQRRWRWVFYLKAFAAFVLAVGALLILSWLVGTIWRDRREQVPRDAAHWCGVALELCVQVLTFVMSVGTALFVFLQVFDRF